MKRVATFDSSFWIHAVYLDLVDFLLEDFELICAKEVERELGRDNPTSRRLKGLFADKQIHLASARSVKIKLYGDGERAAINLALDREIPLLIDDWKPFEAARAAGVEVVNSLSYLVQLYRQQRLPVEKVMEGLGRMVKRGTIKREWINFALEVTAEIRKKGINS